MLKALSKLSNYNKMKFGIKNVCPPMLKELGQGNNGGES